MPSQMLPNTCDLQSLLPSVVAFEERAKEGGNLKESTLKDSVSVESGQVEKSIGRRTSEQTSSVNGCLSAPHEDVLGRGNVLESQGSIFLQHLPSTCELGNLLPVQTSEAFNGRMPSHLSEGTRTAPSPTSSKPRRIVLDHASEDSDFKMFRQLCEAGVCSADDRVSLSTTHYVPYTRSECDPFCAQSPISNEVDVCLPTLEYYRALVLGVPVVDKKWLEEIAVAGKCHGNTEDNSVWGDSGLSQKVKELQNGSSRYAWLKSSAWWAQKCGPGQLPLSRSTLTFEGYCILVPDQDFRRLPVSVRPESSRESSPQDFFKNSAKESGMVENPDHFQHLTKHDMETLCTLLGAKVVQTESELASSDPILTRLVLVPATLPPDRFSDFAEHRLAHAKLVGNMRSFAETPKSQMLWALRSTWLTDSLGAQFHAPLEEYSYGILIHQQSPSEQESVIDRRTPRLDRFVDRRPSRQESLAEL